MEVLQILKNKEVLNPHQQSMLDKINSLKPNELITKHYEPDQKPSIKLITYQEINQNQKNLTYAPGKIKNLEFQKYAKLFGPNDSLGYHYADKIHQMVYFRYNNQEFNELKDSNTSKSVRYFGGMFIPLTLLESENFKSENNIFSALKISAPEIKNSVAHSFAQNSKGSLSDPLFSSNFESGNMMAAIRIHPFEYDIILQNDTNCKASEWFNFAVKFKEQGKYKFNIINLSNENPLYRYGMKVPYYSFFQNGTSQILKSGEGWSFGGTNISFFKTQIRKERQDQNSTYYCLSFEYKCNYRQEIAIFASSIPYTTIDYERFLNRVVYNKLGLYMKMEKLQIFQTLGGASLPAYLFYHCKSKITTTLPKNCSQQKISQIQPSNQNQNPGYLTNQQGFSSGISSTINQHSSELKTIVFLARQHPGEVSASFILEGVIEFIMDTTQFDSIKKNFQFVVVPFVNPDGVKYGNQRVNLAGSDSKRSWENPHPTFEPQVYHIKKLLKTIDQIHPISLVINLSSTNQKYFFVKFSLYSYFKSCSIQKYCGEIPELFPYLVSKRVSQISFQNSEFSPLSKPSFAHTLSEIFPKSLVYDFKTSLYGWTTQSSGQKKQNKSIDSSNKLKEVHKFTPDIYRGMGKDLILTYLEYARVCSKNIGAHQRWLKEIEEIPSYVNEQIRKNQQCYEEKWEKDLLKLDFPQFDQPQIQTQKTQTHKIEIRKLKSIISSNINEGHFNKFRLNSKKRAVKFANNDINNDIDSKKQNQKRQDSSQIMGLSFDKINNNVKFSSSLKQVHSILKKSSITSSLFTSKSHKQVIKHFSNTIKDSSIEKKIPVTQQHNYIKSAHDLFAIPQKKQNKLPGLDRKKSQATFSDKIQMGDNFYKGKYKDSLVKFHSMKRLTPVLEVKPK